MLPVLEDLAQDLSGKAEIVKFNCNAKNKELGKSLNIKVAPTFHIYKNSNKVSPASNAILCLRGRIQPSKEVGKKGLHS